MTAIAVPMPWSIPRLRLGFLAWLLGLLTAFAVITSNFFQLDVVSADYFVDCDAGNDSAAGTSEGTAFLTVERSSDVTSAGDVVWIKGTCPANAAVNATFREVLRLERSEGGTAGNFITWKGWPGEFNQLGNGDDDDTVFTITTNGADFIRFENLNFVGSANSCFYNVKHFEPLDPSTNVEVIHNTFTRCAKGFVVQDATDCMNSFGHDAIVSHGTSVNFLIDGNRIDQTGRTVSELVRTTICDPIGVTDNHLYRHDHPLHLKGVGVIAINNVITNYSAGLGIKIDGYIDTTILAADEFSHIIMNNTIGPNISLQPYHKCSGRAIAMARSSFPAPNRLDYPKFKVENNIMIDQVLEGTLEECKSPIRININGAINMDPLTTCKNNISVTTGDAGYIDAISVCQEHIVTTYGSGKVSGNTLNADIAVLDFADEANEDYHIGAGSIAVDASNDDAATPSRDFDDRVRINIPDAGAFEQ